MSWEPALPYAILLQDIHGYKENKLVFGYSSGFSNKYVLRGTLLVKLSQDEVREVTHQSGITPPLNFKVLKEPAVKLHCKVNNVLLLNYKQKELLLAIGSINDRFDAADKVEWAEKLTEGSTVYVSIPTISTTTKGIVRYIGKLPGEVGTKFGVELLVCNGKYIYVCLACNHMWLSFLNQTVTNGSVLSQDKLENQIYFDLQPYKNKSMFYHPKTRRFAVS